MVGGQINREVIYSSNNSYIAKDIRYFYDANGNPSSIRVFSRTSATAEPTKTTYYLLTNIQGDVVGIYNDSGTKIYEYAYDAWGNIIKSSQVSTGGNTAHAVNPFRYRGYYFDTETGFYYLQSRYYNPEWGRFLNADVYVNANGDLMGYNMYAYCSNNPVMGRDPNGYVSWWGVAAGALIATAGIAIAALSYGVGSPIGAAMVFEGGALIAGTGLFTIGCAIEEQAMVLDLSVSDNGGNKSGASLVVDFAGETMDLYSHAGKSAGTDSGPSVSYAVGLVFNYTKPGDYGGPFVDAGGGINGWGVDYCRSPDLNPESCYAISATRSWPPSNGANAYAGFDQYIQVGSWGW